MNNIISLVIIVDNIDNFHKVLTNINSQSIKNLELFILVKSKYLTSIKLLQDTKLKIIEMNDTDTLISYLISIISNSKGDLFTILNSSDINHYKRFEIQSYFMKENPSFSICSCLELPLFTDSNLLINSYDSNKFAKENEIDFAVLAGYIPLDLYTFMIRKDFFISLSKFLPNYNLDSELDLILYFLRYTSIEKIPKVLYYFKNSRIPYKENIIMDNSLNSLNKISIFNRNKSIEYRNFLSQAVLKNSNIAVIDIIIKYNILIIINNLSVGGTETYILSISTALRNLGIYTYILTTGGILEDLFIKNNIPVLKVNFSTGYSIESISKIVSNFNIKLIHLHLPNDLHLSYTIYEYLNIPIVLTIHGTFYPKNIIKDYYKYLSKIIFVSEESQNYYLDIISNNNSLYSLIPNSVNTPLCTNTNKFLHELLSIPTNGKVILYCSRLSPSKAALAITFLKSFEEIASNVDNIYALIIGEGSDKILIDSYAKNINSTYSNKRVFVIGAVYNILDYYCDSYFVVGTGRVALEAMSCSKTIVSLGLNNSPVIVSENNILNIISNNFGDHYCEIQTKRLGSYSKNLTDIFNYLINNPSECELIGNWGNNYASSNLNIKNSSNHIAKIFDDILDFY